MFLLACKATYPTTTTEAAITEKEVNNFGLIFILKCPADCIDGALNSYRSVMGCEGLDAGSVGLE